MAKPTFSIIIPAYNVADYIETCVQSVLRQSFRDYEIIIVDDGSTDSTPQLLQKLHDTRITIIHQSNAGLSTARNRGIAAANGTYLILLDGDDFLLPNTLSTLAEHTASRPDIIRFQVQDSYADGRVVSYPEQPFISSNGPAAFRHLLSYHYIDNAWCYCYRTAFFKQHHFAYAPGRLAEDFGLTPLIIARAQQVISIPHVGYSYRQRTGSIMHDPARLRARVQDTFAQLPALVAKIASIPDTTHITHYLVLSFLTLAAQLPYPEFIQFYHQFKQANLVRYIHPASLRAWPRAYLAKFSPRLFHFFVSRRIL